MGGSALRTPEFSFCTGQNSRLTTVSNSRPRSFQDKDAWWHVLSSPTLAGHSSALVQRESRPGCALSTGPEEGGEGGRWGPEMEEWLCRSL